LIALTLSTAIRAANLLAGSMWDILKGTELPLAWMVKEEPWIIFILRDPGAALNTSIFICFRQKMESVCI
jgi:hypothetical protein